MPQPQSDTPDLGGRRRTLSPALLTTSLGRVLAVVLVGLVLAVGLAVYRSQQGPASLPPGASGPERLSWCGRDYDRIHTRPLTRQAIDSIPAALPGDQPYPTTRVGSYPAAGGRPLYAKLTPEQERAADGLPCAMSVFLQVGTDAYQEYELVGGP